MQTRGGVMKIDELRSTIKKYEKEELHYIIAQMYKMLPKKIKEEKNVDNLINDCSSFSNKAKKNQQLEPEINVEHLFYSVDDFDELARRGYYFRRNKTVTDSQRRKWRRTFKDYLNKLISIRSNSEHFETATEKIIMLRSLLEYASGHYCFTSCEVYEQLNISDYELAQIIISRIFSGLDFETALKKSIRTSFFKREKTYHSPILDFIKTQDQIELAISTAYKERTYILSKTKEQYIIDNVNLSIYFFIFILMIRQGDFEKGLEVFKKNIRRDKFGIDEVNFFIVMLLYLNDYNELARNYHEVYMTEQERENSIIKNRFVSIVEELNL